MLAKTSQPGSPARDMFAEGLPDFESIRVLCVGDVLIDRFIHGSVERVSPESPVPIILLGAIDNVPGGAANVARNVASLGGKCTLIGVTGFDAAGRELETLLSENAGITPCFLQDQGRATTEKTRFVAQGQHLLRADREEAGDIAAQIAHDIVVEFARQLEMHDVVVLSDYAKGVLTDEVVTGVIALANDASIPVVVDPKSARLAKYRGATLITPNAKETTAATGIVIADDESADHGGQLALANVGIGSVLITRAAQGMSLVRTGEPTLHIPATAREVFDVVGAGDTVVAMLALCLGAGMALPDSARLANAAAGIVVGKRGTATISRTELIDEIASMMNSGRNLAIAKTLDWDTAVKQTKRWREEGLTVGFTNGCFDILHVGHVKLLEYARSQCDKLIVALNSDASVSRLKGPARPLNPEMDRAEVIGALAMVDGVVVFSQDTPRQLIDELQPQVLVKGGDYSLDTVVGAELVLKRGGQVLLFDLVPGRSTSQIVTRAQVAI